MDLKHFVFWLAVPCVLLLLLVLARTNTHDVVTDDNYAELGYYELPEPKPITDFSMSDHLNRPVNLSSLKGKVSILFFGFTRCPDVCPTTLSIINMAVSGIQNPPQVIMVSVDPEQDTPSALAAYLAAFNDSFIGFTGTEAEVTQLANQLDVGFKQRPLGDGNLTVDHPANIVVVDKKGQYQGLIRPPHRVENLAPVLELLQKDA